ncbi:MAG: membrane protein insertase YidC [Microbacterium sp.]
MDFFAFPPLAFLLDLAYSGLLGLSTLLSPLTAASASLAIVLVTLLVRAALVPAGISQARAEQTRARLAPRLRDIQKRWGKNPERLQREMMQLYRDENTSPFAGLLPILIQAPIIGLLYAIFLHPVIAGHPNELLTETLLGVPLGSSLAGAVAAGATDAATLAVFAVLVLLIAAVGEVTRRLLRPEPAPPVEGSPLPAIPVGLLGVLQFATAVVAIFVPLAAGLYLLVTVTWTLGQRLVLRRVYPPTPRIAA